MEAGFSEVAEKQRQNEQTHTTIKTDLDNFQTQTKAIQNSICIIIYFADYRSHDKNCKFPVQRKLVENMSMA